MTELVNIERMSYGADAVGHLASGKAVFVRGAVPGDVVEIELVEDKERFATARIAKVVEPGSDRVEVREGALSTLAPWAQLSYAAQLAAKQANVRDTLIRVGHLAPDDVDAAMRPIIASKDEWGYRNKLEMGVARDKNGRLELGFHVAGAPGVDAAQTCPLGNRMLAQAPRALRGALRYLEGRDGDLGLYRVGIRGSLATGSVEVALWTPPGPFPRGFAAKMLRDAVSATSVVRVIAEEGAARKVKRVEVLDGDGFWRENIMLGGMAIGGATGASLSVAEATEGESVAENASRPVCLQASAPSFFQVNTKQAAKLVGLALDGLAPRPGERIADLYSGVGTFTVPLALTGARVSAIELEGSAARDLRRNCARARVDVDVVCDDASRALPKLSKGGLDGLLVDPPRAGLDKRVVAHISDASPKRIAYVSCDPQTLARDAARLRAKGYVLVSAVPVDLFPQTYHVECVCMFEKA